MDENQNIEKKSLKVIQNKTSAWAELAKDCVCFANARGGSILIGIEDDVMLPPIGQTIAADLPEIIRKRMAELTINVATNVQIIKAENGGEFIELRVFPSVSTIASTTDGRYYFRIADKCNPVMPDELLRLLTDKPSYNWETKVVRSVRRTEYDSSKWQSFIREIKASERVSSFVKAKSDDELMDHYLMADGDFLTNLGILWIGKRTDRAKLLYAPTVQFLKFDESGDRVNKIVWDDYSLNPMELIEDIWAKIPDWREGVEISDGLFRKHIPHYEEEVVRELLVNALVHRPYTTRGDIFINLFTDRMEIHNPGLFPLGVTTKNILHKAIRRNEHLAKVFYDLKLMEREGSGYDRIYEIMLSNGKQLPQPTEGDDRVSVAVFKRIIRNEVVTLVDRINNEFHLRQKEIICLGLIAQNNALSATEFSKLLALPEQNGIRDWLGRLTDFGVIQSQGRTKGVEYFVAPDWLHKTRYKGKTNLKRIENHRLSELIYQDLKTYPSSSISEIHKRIGMEIPLRKLRTQLQTLTLTGKVIPKGEKKWRRYSIDRKA